LDGLRLMQVSRGGLKATVSPDSVTDGGALWAPGVDVPPFHPSGYMDKAPLFLQRRRALIIGGEARRMRNSKPRGWRRSPMSSVQRRTIHVSFDQMLRRADALLMA
jgi:hypothetical protein